MKKSFLFQLSTAALLLNFSAGAQWAVGGNNLATNGAIGSNTNYSVIFKSNNLSQAILTNTGRWHFGGISVPTSRMQVTHNSIPGDPQLLLYEPANDYARFYFKNTNTSNYFGFAGSPAASNAAAKLNFLYSAVGDIMTIQGDKKVGIGKNNPTTTLDVMGGNWDINSTEGDFKIGNATHRLKMGVALAGGGAGDARISAVGGTSRLMLGINDALTIDGAGQVGIGTITPTRKLDVAGNIRTSYPSTHYLEMVIPGTSSFQNDWRLENSGSSFYLSSSTTDFTSFCDIARFGTCSDTYKMTVYGNALASGGTWQVSDARLKKEVAEFSSAMDIIKKLKPKTYYFKSAEYAKLALPTAKQYGFIAQELEAVMPELVTTSTEFFTNGTADRKGEEIKAINYTELIPILVKAVQEQEVKIAAQQQQIETLQQVVNGLTKGKGNTLSPNANTTLSVSSASLEQNVPNPAGTATSIRYSLPSGAKTAQISITDLMGNLIKTIALPLTGKGVINVDTHQLINGNYNYTLVIDGQTIQTKKLVIAK